MTEIWKPIEGFDGWYEVSNLGNVRSWRGHRGSRRIEPRLRKLVPDKDGYLTLMLPQGNVKRSLKVHAVVAATFIGKRPEGFDINHLNGNKEDNRVENLEYVSRTNNMRHARDVLNSAGEQILTREQAEKIIVLLTEGRLAQYQIASMFGVSHYAISYIWTGNSWADLFRGYPTGISYSVWRKLQQSKSTTKDTQENE